MNNYVLTSDASGNATWKDPLLSSLWQKNVTNDISFLAGKIGIGTSTPNELVQFGDRFVFHNGGTKIFGFNFKFDPTIGDVRILPNVGFSELRFNNDGSFIIQNAPVGATGVAVSAQGRFTMDGIGGAQFQSFYGNGLQGGVKMIDGNNNLNLITTGVNNADLLFQSNTNQSDIVFNDKVGVLRGLLRVDVSGTDVAMTFKKYNGSTPVKDLFKVGYDGILYAAEIKVQLPVSGAFPDYVFDKEYKLMPLAELDKYITENKHLPNINTAAEVKENGLALGDMQVKQMEKIEELSLYIIAINKRLQEVEAKNTALQNQVQALQNK